MSDENDTAALSDEALLAIADAYLNRDITQRHGSMNIRTVDMTEDRAMVGSGVVRRDLPLLAGRSTSLSRLAAKLLGHGTVETEQLVEVHYQCETKAAFVFVRRGEVVLNLSSQPPIIR